MNKKIGIVLLLIVLLVGTSIALITNPSIQEGDTTITLNKENKVTMEAQGLTDFNILETKCNSEVCTAILENRELHIEYSITVPSKYCADPEAFPNECSNYIDYTETEVKELRDAKIKLELETLAEEIRQADTKQETVYIGKGTITIIG